MFRFPTWPYYPLDALPPNWSTAYRVHTIVPKVSACRGPQPLYRLFRHDIIPYLRGFQPRRWHADIQARSKENARAHPHSRRDICLQRIVVRGILLDYADKSFATERINALALPRRNRRRRTIPPPGDNEEPKPLEDVCTHSTR